MKPKKCKRRTNKYTKRRQKQKHIGGGYTRKKIIEGIQSTIKSAQRTFEDARIGYRNAIATYELKKLYDTEQGQYVFEQLGRINFERNPKGVLRELINQVLPANGLIFDNDEAYIGKIGDLTQAYEKINLDGLKDLKSNHSDLLDFFEKFLLLLKDEKYISDISKHRNMSKGQKKSKNRNSMFNEENVTNSTL